MTDQATRLRGLMQDQTSQSVAVSSDLNLPVDGSSGRAHTIAITSGKGGVGKSVIALNLAIAMAEMGKSVCLLDANLGLGNLDLLCGLNGYWNLEHVVSGARRLEQILLDGPAGIHLVPGASGLHELADCSDAVQKEILSQLKSLEQSHDVIVIDTSSGIHRSVREFALSADDILLVTTPEVTAIADTYATIKSLMNAHLESLQVLVNRSEESQAEKICERLQQTSNVFLRVSTDFGTAIPDDPEVVASVAERTPVLIQSPGSPASEAIRSLARQLCAQRTDGANDKHYFARLGKKMLSKIA